MCDYPDHEPEGQDPQGSGKLLAGEHQTFDVLVWDNGSQDSTAEAISESYPNIEVHDHPTNSGSRLRS
jgi:hypothetical protein